MANQEWDNGKSIISWHQYSINVQPTYTYQLSSVVFLRKPTEICVNYKLCVGIYKNVV